MTPAGFAHSEIRGSEGMCPSPRLIAAYHVLRRLPVPRHPPCALTIFFSMVRTYLHSGALAPACDQMRSSLKKIDFVTLCSSQGTARDEPSRPDTERSRAAKADISGN